MPAVEVSRHGGSGLAHVLVVSMGTVGDLYPMLALSLVLRGRGHLVTLLAPAVHEATVIDAGLRFFPLGTVDDYHAALVDPNLWDARKGFEVVWRTALPALKVIPDLVARQPSNQPLLMLAHPLALSAADIARTVRPDMDIVATWLAPANLRTCHDLRTLGPIPIPAWLSTSWRRWLWDQVDARIIDPVALPSLNAERRARGLPTVAHFIDHYQQVANRSVSLFPAWYGAPQPDWPQPTLAGDFPLYDPDPSRSMPSELVRFLDQGEAPIVFTAGTGHLQGDHYFEQAVRVCRKVGKRAILLTRQRPQFLTELPASIIWCEFAPLAQLLPRAAALVHHGGIGTTAEALRAGVRQLVAPMAHDQFDNAARVVTLGVGVSRSAASLSCPRMVRLLRTLLRSETIGRQCNEVASRLRTAPDLLPITDFIVGARQAESR